MKDEKETREKLLISAKCEFMEKGYTAASLRTICKNAGVTTGALYFFFKDKEDLFAALVQEPLNMLLTVMENHYREELNMLETMETLSDEHSDDMQAGREVIQYIYQHYDEFLLVITKSQGSRFEKSVEQFVSISEKHYHILANWMSEKWKLPKPDDYMIHWISHIQIDAFVHMITHIKSGEEASGHVNEIIQFLTGGWYAVHGVYSKFFKSGDHKL